MPSAAGSSSLRPAKAAHRYRPGQAPKGYDDDRDRAESSDESDEDAKTRSKQPRQQQQKRNDGLTVLNEGHKLPTTSSTQKQPASRAIMVQVTKELGQGAAVASSSEEESSEEEEQHAKPAYRPPPGSVAAGKAKAESSEEESSSSEEESEDEPAPAPLYKPVFVAKRNRDTVAKDPLASLDPEEAEMKRQAELEERRKQSTHLAGEAIKRALAGKDKSEVAGLKDVDDTDGTDDQGEFEQWKLRELMRVKREKEVNVEREREREEVEARRALPEALRLKEDTERAAALRAGKMANRGQQNFLQKYHHKGAFYADDEILSRYDYTAPTESAVRDVSALPAAMQVRNFGKMGRTKYTHLVDQDTSDRNAGWSGSSGSARGKQGADNLNQGCFNCGGNHMKKDCPQLENGLGPAGASGANAGPIGRRRRNSRSTSPPRRDSRRRSRSRDRNRSRSRSRSRSPPRRKDDRGSDRFERSRDSYRPSDSGRQRDDRDREDKRRRYD